MSVLIGDTKAKLYFGDILLNDVIPVTGLPDFKGYVSSDNGVPIAKTDTDFDTSKAFDIIFCFWLGSNPTGTTGAAIGTYDMNDQYKYPSIEIRLGTGIWFGASSDGSNWDLISKTVEFNFVQNSYNYMKISHDTSDENHKLINVYHSTDRNTWSLINTTDIGSSTVFNTSSVKMCFGGNAFASSLTFPSEEDFHMAIERCKVISEGITIFGYDDAGA